MNEGYWLVLCMLGKECIIHSNPDMNGEVIKEL